MSDTQEDVRLARQPLPPHYGNIDAQRLHACAKQLQQALAAYEALGSVEYLAALVKEHEGRREHDYTGAGIAHDEAERLREGTCSNAPSTD